MSSDQPEWIIRAQRVLGLRVRDARLYADLTQEQLAERAGIDRSTLQRIERGQNDAKFSHLARVARTLNVPTRDLLP